mmetsp:Transcript_58933/g.140179  ORF Transcript_58933/g.140179 Transcript_58933/m.140179 type:complete len:130 (+) Transcript_58933:167-556(+)
MGRLGRKRSSPPARNMRDSLHNRFQIPEEEVLMEEFSCALQEDARLLQGRIFVFNNFVCFSCSLLGSERALRLAFSDIDAIERQDSAYLENTIQVKVGAESYKLTSFIYREEALLCLLQRQALLRNGAA